MARGQAAGHPAHRLGCSISPPSKLLTPPPLILQALCGVSTNDASPASRSEEPSLAAPAAPAAPAMPAAVAVPAASPLPPTLASTLVAVKLHDFVLAQGGLGLPMHSLALFLSSLASEEERSLVHGAKLPGLRLGIRSFAAQHRTGLTRDSRPPSVRPTAPHHQAHSAPASAASPARTFPARSRLGHPREKASRERRAACLRAPSGWRLGRD